MKIRAYFAMELIEKKRYIKAMNSLPLSMGSMSKDLWI